jgi:monoamine oxidase
LRKDTSFDEFLRTRKGRFRPREKARLARLFVEGFNAAHAGRISVRSLVEAGRIEEEIEGDRLFRLVQGYGALVDALARSWDPARVRVHLRSVARRIEWRKHRVDVEVVSPDGSRARSLVGRKLIVTLPLGVLQAEPPAKGALAFHPDLPAKREAAHALEMGAVVKVALRFDRAFWEDEVVPAAGGKGRLEDMSFFHDARAAVPTWWTMLPLRTRMLMGWAGGPKAEALSGKPRAWVYRAALGSLGLALRMSVRRLERRVEAYEVADWQSDAFSRGAYSYIPAGAVPAMKRLARPVEDTIFFAGEATAHEGQSSTVPGAWRTGRRAAREVLGRRLRADR